MNTDKLFNQYLNTFNEIGVVEEANAPLFRVSGLPGAKINERVIFESGQQGQIIALQENLIEVIPFSQERIQPATRVVRTGEPVSVGVSTDLVGQIVNALGDPLLPGKALGKIEEVRPIDTYSTDISDRKLVKEPFTTGINLVDLVVPLGKGQRELIIGDRNTGKTYITFQAMLNHARSGGIVIYTAIGKKQGQISKLQDFMKNHDVSDQVIIVAASASSSQAEIITAPFTAMTIAEFFRDKGKDVLIILDDLTTQAKFYREISLRSGRFPGRDSYPGDIFNLQARLLERAGNFANGSITCLAIADTVQGNLTSYIPTNLMSITDGHFYIDTGMFFEGKRPAINPFLSVTRVGRQTQTRLRQSISQELFQALSNYEKAVNFSRFGSQFSSGLQESLKLGERLWHLFTQKFPLIIPYELQAYLVALSWKSTEPIDVEAYVKQYETQATFRKSVDTLTQKAQSFEELLSLVGTK